MEKRLPSFDFSRGQYFLRCIVSEPMSQASLSETETKPRGSFHGRSLQDLLEADPDAPPGRVPDVPCTSFLSTVPSLLSRGEMYVCWGRGCSTRCSCSHGKSPGRCWPRRQLGRTKHRKTHYFCSFLNLSPGLVAGFKNTTKCLLPTKDF